MAQKRYWNWKDDDSTFSLNQRDSLLLPSGRYCGFDVDLSSLNAWNLILIHTETGREKVKQDLTFSDKTGAWKSPQGVIVEEDDSIIIAITPIQVLASGGRYDLIVAEHEYDEVTGGSSAIYKKIEGTPSTTPTVPSLQTPESQIILGILFIPFSATALDSSGVVYTQSVVPDFGHDETIVHEEELQQEVSTLNQTISDLNDELDSEVVRLDEKIDDLEDEVLLRDLKLHGWFNERVSSLDKTLANVTKIFAIEPNVIFTDGVVFVARQTAGTVSTYNKVTGSTLGSYTDELVAPTKPFVIDAQSEELYILDINHASHRVLIFSMDTNAVSSRIITNAGASNPRDMFITKEGKIYILTRDTGVKVFDTGGFVFPSEHFGSGDWTEGSSIFIAYGKAYISDRDTYSILVYDLATGLALADETIVADVSADLRDIFIQGQKLYVTDFTNSKVLVYDLSSKNLLYSDFISTGLTDPSALFLDKETDKAYVYDNTAGKILVFKQNLKVVHI